MVREPLLSELFSEVMKDVCCAIAVPSIQAAFTIPTKPKGANHTPQFAESARLPESFDATMTTCKGLAMTGFRVLADDDFYSRVSVP